MKTLDRRRTMLLAAGSLAAGAGPGSDAAGSENMTENERYASGLDVLRRIGGPDFDGPIGRLARISPDMARFTVAFPYGDILSRPGLDLRTRQICTVSSVMALGSAQPQLRFHMDGLLNAGGTPGDLVELLILATATLGFPAAIDAIGIVRAIFSQRDLRFETSGPAGSPPSADRVARGLALIRAELGSEAFQHVAQLQKVSPELGRWTLEFFYGDVLARRGMAAGIKHLAIASMLAAAGNRHNALMRHLRAALANGATATQAEEAMMQISIYAGFPAALNAFAALGGALDHENGSATDEDASIDGFRSESDMVRRQRGLEALAKTSASVGAAVVNSFDDLAPEIGAMIVDHSYGDIFCRPGIDAKTRELTACAALAAKATRSVGTPLRVHINAALNVGASRAEIIEVLLNLLPYAGYPVVQDAVRIAGEEFAKRITDP